MLVILSRVKSLLRGRYILNTNQCSLAKKHMFSFFVCLYKDFHNSFSNLRPFYVLFFISAHKKHEAYLEKMSMLITDKTLGHISINISDIIEINNRSESTYPVHMIIRQHICLE